MTRSLPPGRGESEILWFQRRSFLQAAAAWTAMGGWAAAHAQQRGNIIELQGDVLLNGRTLRPTDTIQTGDEIQTGPGASLIFVIGGDAFHLRQNSRLQVRRGETLNTVSVLRLISGAAASVWSPGGRRQVVTPTLTAGIRGTGVYAEVLADGSQRSYFCNCYGEVELSAGREQLVSTSRYHQSFWADEQRVEGRQLRPAPGWNHTDEELEFLARLVGQQTAWQISGKPPKNAAAL